MARLITSLVVASALLAAACAQETADPTALPTLVSQPPETSVIAPSATVPDITSLWNGTSETAIVSQTSVIAESTTAAETVTLTEVSLVNQTTTDDFLNATTAVPDSAHGAAVASAAAVLAATAGLFLGLF